MGFFNILSAVNRCYNHTADERIPLNIGIEEEQEERLPTKKDIIPARWILALLGSSGFMSIYGLKVNLSVAIMAMVNHTALAINEGDGHPTGSNYTCESEIKRDKRVEDGPFAWNENIQGFVLAAYFYGYIVTQVPGGWFAEKFSAKHVFGLGVLLNALFTLLAPVAAEMGYAWLALMRIGMGIAGGVTLPAMHVLIAKWAPPNERSKMSSTIYAGMILGTLVCLPLSGVLASGLGWKSVFYIQGGLSALWYALWLVLVYDSPDVHPRVAPKERKMIEEAIQQLSGGKIHDKTMAVPWKAVFTSPAVWAIIVAHTCCNWGWYMLLMKLPTYMRYILHFDIKANAWLSAVPFLCMWIFTMLLATILDGLRERSLITTTFARKLATGVASILPGICFVLVTYVGCHEALAVAFLTLGTMFMGGMYSGFLSNHIDIAPPFAGTLMGISNTFATIPGIAVPTIIGFMTRGSQTVETWRAIFYITLGILTIGAITFTLLGSGEQQEWAKQKSSIDDEEEEAEGKIRLKDASQ